MKLVPFNINDRVFVKLKPEGHKIWMDYYNEFLPAHQQRSLKYYEDQADENGYVKLQAHEFMRIFGPVIKMCKEPMFETDILIELPE